MKHTVMPINVTYSGDVPNKNVIAAILGTLADELRDPKSPMFKDCAEWLSRRENWGADPKEAWRKALGE